MSSSAEPSEERNRREAQLPSAGALWAPVRSDRSNDAASSATYNDGLIDQRGVVALFNRRVKRIAIEMGDAELCQFFMFDETGRLAVWAAARIGGKSFQMTASAAQHVCVGISRIRRFFRR